MASSEDRKSKQQKNTRKSPMMHLLAGGSAGLVESTCCHPLDTIKTRMQLRASAGSQFGLFKTAYRIVSNESFFALYKGLSAVVAGIVPKMMVRFTSFEMYKDYLRGNSQQEALPKSKILLAGLGSGVTEAILVVTPAEVCKIRMQVIFLRSSILNISLRIRKINVLDILCRNVCIFGN
mmetsp:Transcript_19101/g.24079  ORF Transcript_19101/g.24079 Transcript_19101/m.24079 type:complete len:179 (+) Transcript_19101:114-650(+)